MTVQNDDMKNGKYSGAFISVAYFAFNVVTSVAIVIVNKFLMSPIYGAGFKYGAFWWTVAFLAQLTACLAIAT